MAPKLVELEARVKTQDMRLRGKYGSAWMELPTNVDKEVVAVLRSLKSNSDLRRVWNLDDLK